MPEIVNQQGDDAAFDIEAFDAAAFATGTVWRRLEPDAPASAFDPAAFAGDAFQAEAWAREAEPSVGLGYGAGSYGGTPYGGSGWVRQDQGLAAWTRA